MKVYLVNRGEEDHVIDIFIKLRVPYVLVSYFYILDSPRLQKIVDYYKKGYWKGFILDSGAFSFMNTLQDVSVEVLDRYVEKYVRYIRDHHIEHFIELDVDIVTGLEKVEEYRKFIEKETGKKVIPVWHKSRGLEYWKWMIAHYDYVAIGGFVIKEIKLAREKNFVRELVRMAHDRGVEVHGLGLGSPKYIKEVGFDSVDISSWNSYRWGVVFTWDPFKKKVKKIAAQKLHKKLVPSKRHAIALHNLKVFIKYVKYMEGLQ